MSRSRAIDTRLEKLIPSVEEYIVAGVLTRQEAKDLIRKRTDVEYKLVAKPLLLVDVNRALEVESEIEARIVEYCAQSKIILKYRWAAVERMEQIFGIAMKHLKDPAERESVRLRFVTFLKKNKKNGSLSRHYAELVVKYPFVASYWVEAVLWGVENNEIDNARATIQHAMKLLPHEADVWVCAAAVEMEFAMKLLRTVAKEHNDRQKDSKIEEDVVDRLTRENSELALLLLNLQLVTVVTDEMLSNAKAATPVAVRRMYECILKYPCGAKCAEDFLVSAVRRCLLPAFAEPEARVHRAEVPWLSAEAGHVVAALATHPLTRNDGFHSSEDCSEFLRRTSTETKKHISTPQQHRHNHLAALCRTLSLLYSPHWASCGVLQNFSKFVVPTLQETFVRMIDCPVPRGPQAQDKPSVPFLDDSKKRTIGAMGLRFAATPATTIADLLQSIMSTFNDSRRQATGIVLEAIKVSTFGDDDNILEAHAPRTSITWPSSIASRFVSGDELLALTSSAASASQGTLTLIDVHHAVLRFGSVAKPDATEIIKFMQLGGVLTKDENLLVNAPINTWKLLLLLEQVAPTTLVQGQTSVNSDDDDEIPSFKKRRLESDATLGIVSFGLKGIRFLGSHVTPLLTPQEAELQCEGLFRLSHAVVCNLLSVGSITRSTVASALQQSKGVTIAAVVEVLRVVSQFAPIPHGILQRIVVPWSEGLCLFHESSPESSALQRSRALQDARNAHEKVLAQYTIKSHKLLNSPFLCLRFDENGSLLCEATQSTRVSVPELNVRDWVAFVAFEREVSKDLKASQKLTQRALKETLDARGLLLALQ